MRSCPFLLLALLSLPLPALAADDSLDLSDRESSAKEFSSRNKPKVVNGSMESVVCVTSDQLNVRNDRLDKVLFSVPKYELVKTFQGWGNNKKTKKVDGVKHTFVKVQFPSREDESQSVGWVSQVFVKAKSQCAGAVKEEKKVIAQEKREEEAAGTGLITSLKDSDCCDFPLIKAPRASISSRGMWNFGWRRGGGSRTHAACDLYRYKNEPFVAVAPGTVIRNLYYFYQGTYALEVKHAGDFVVRYGETTGRAGAGVRGGRRVNTGQTLGYIGKTSHPMPMLHFELYSGARTGSLSSRANRYQRRSDLLNPTQYLLKWQDNKFRDRK